jgi:hypothetical protein
MSCPVDSDDLASFGLLVGVAYWLL